jgi:hypothetical protein
MVLGLSWGQLALVLGASVALFGKVSSYDLSLLQAWLLGLKNLARLFACGVYFRVQVVGLEWFYYRCGDTICEDDKFEGRIAFGHLERDLISEMMILWGMDIPQD